MKLTEKETKLLGDLKSQEEVCIEKYRKYSEQAHTAGLKDLFCSIQHTEQSHFDTLDSIMRGTEPKMPGSPVIQTGYGGGVQNYTDAGTRQNDEFLCRDALSTEKHVSGVYDTCIFEFCDTAVRTALNHIQSEEQKHGELIYGYMKENGMYPQA